VRVGIPSVVDAALLVHHVGLSLAKELILTGAAYRPEQLPGLFTTLSLDEIVPAMLTLTPEVIAAQKSLFETWLNAALQEGIDVSREVFASVFALPVTRSAIERYRR
jgi:enoyl-CoA hydratase/carnithine racemase